MPRCKRSPPIIYFSSETACHYVHNRVRKNTVHGNLCFLPLVSMFCLANVLFKCTKTAFIRNVVTVTVRLKVIQAQMKSRELLQEFTDGGWFWRYFVICFLRRCWHGCGFGLLCQNVSFGVLEPLVVCFPLPVWIYNSVLGGLSLLNTGSWLSSAGKQLFCMDCCVLHCHCCAWHLKDCS